MSDFMMFDKIDDNVQQNMPINENVNIEQPQVIQGTRIPKNQQVQQSQVQSFQQPVNTTQNFNQQSNIVTGESTEQNLAILMNVKDYYSDSEWKQKYALYGIECAKINVDSFNLTSSDIAVAAGRIDNLLTPVRLDYANIQSRLAVYELQLKVADQAAFKQVYDDFNSKGLKMPPIDDRKALATSYVQSMKRPEDNLSLYELRERYSARAIQIESIVKILQDKKDLLITYSAALKIENTSNNFTANVPTNNQMNQMRN
jgi:hypothetical protein